MYLLPLLSWNGPWTVTSEQYLAAYKDIKALFYVKMAYIHTSPMFFSLLKILWLQQVENLFSDETVFFPPTVSLFWLQKKTG